MIEAEGYRARFEGARYRYLRVDGFVYWASRSLWTPGRNLNRCPWADVAGSPSTSRRGSLCDAQMVTKMLTTPPSVAIAANEKPCPPGLFFMGGAWLEHATPCL